MAKTKTAPDGMTCSAFAAMMNCDRHELSRKLTELKCEPIGKRNGGQVFNLRDLVLAFSGGDERAERIRRTRAEAKRLELQNAKTEGELVDALEVTRLVQKLCGGIKQKILSSPLPPGIQDSILRDLLSLKDRDWAS